MDQLSFDRDVREEISIQDRSAADARASGDKIIINATPDMLSFVHTFTTKAKCVCMVKGSRIICLRGN